MFFAFVKRFVCSLRDFALSFAKGRQRAAFLFLPSSALSRFFRFSFFSNSQSIARKNPIQASGSA